jgi:hypothetical protein
MAIKGLSKLTTPAAALELAVTPATGAFVAEVVVVSTGNDDEGWPNSKVHPGPAKKKLQAGNGYTLVVKVEFLAAATARVALDTFDAAGNPLNTHSWSIVGAKGDVRFRIAFVKA